MPRRNSTSFTVRPAQGGRLITQTSPDNIGPTNYSVKTNWRRFGDHEILRAGHLFFAPNAGMPATPQALNTGGPDVIGMWEAIRPNDTRALVAATATTIYRYNYTTAVWDTVGTGYSSSTVEWQGEQLDGCLILNNAIDLPCTLRVEDSGTIPIYEMRDIGIASVGRISVFNGFLLCSDVTLIAAASLNTVMNSGSPYGLVDPSITNRIHYMFVWSDFGDSRNWSPVIHGTIVSTSKDHVTLDFPCPYAFPVGSKLAVIGAGPGGTTLGGQPGIEDGVVVTDNTGSVLTVSVPADAALTYPLSVSVTRFADVSTFSGSSTIKDDSSHIVTHRVLKQVLVVYRTSGIWIGRYTGLVETPFKFTPIYRGAIVPQYPRAIIDVEGDYHLFATSSEFYYFDGSGSPRVHLAMNDAANLFFKGLSPALLFKPFASLNPLHKEVWFHSPNGVLAYDYLYKSASWIDQPYSAAVYHQRPGGTENWFSMALGGQILQYGFVDPTVITYQRLGVPVNHLLAHGEVGLNDDKDEKDLLSYMPLFEKIKNPVTVTVSGRDNIADLTNLLFTEVLLTPSTQPLIETFFRNIYFQDSISYTSVDNTPVSYLGSTFTFGGVNSAGATRNNNGNT